MTYQEIIAEMTRRGFTFYDWNASSGDADQRASKYSILQTALSHVGQVSRIILLAHDSQGKQELVEALPEIIDGYREAGYRFEKITPQVKPIHFSYQ